jgi:hypothetical protein
MAIKRYDVPLVLHQLPEVRGFPSWSRTGIENPVAGLRVKQKGDQLGGFIFHVTPAILQRGELSRISTFVQGQSNRAHGGFLREYPFRLEAGKQGGTGAPQRIGSDR